MAINLEKYKNQIQNAWKDVLDEKTFTNWALFGYEGNTNDLLVVGKGDGGIDEMKEDLNSNKIMYAFCQVLDPKTSLRKFVLINWQGEGTPLVRKGVCANHVHDVANLLKGFHVTVNARTEEDVDTDLIIDKVAKSTASSYSFDERLDLSKDGFQKPNSAYKKVEPCKEINPIERDRFWAEEEEEEKRRQQEEHRRKREEQLKLEKERMEREAVEAKRRERTSENTPAPKSNVCSIKEETKLISQLRKTHRVPVEITDKTEELRKMRTKETEELISKRTVNARAIFEQNTSAGQFNTVRTARQVKKIDISKFDQTKQISPVAFNSGPKNSPKVAQKNSTEDKINNVHIMQNDVSSESIKINRDTDIANGPLYIKEEYKEVESVYSDEDSGLQAQALYDYQAADETEISFDPGDIITHIEQIDPGWWQGLGPSGTYGLFPANYVQLLSNGAEYSEV